jgi:hypothetical protein
MLSLAYRISLFSFSVHPSKGVAPSLAPSGENIASFQRNTDSASTTRPAELDFTAWERALYAFLFLVYCTVIVPFICA